MSNKLKSTFEAPNIFRRIRNATGLSQRALADIFKLATTTVTLWETGRHKPAGSSIKAICQYLDAHPEIGISSGEFMENL